MVPQVSCRPLVLEFQFTAPFPFESLSVFAPVSAADREGKKRIYADPRLARAFRARASEATLTRNWDAIVDQRVSRPSPRSPSAASRRSRRSAASTRST